MEIETFYEYQERNQRWFGESRDDYARRTSREYAQKVLTNVEYNPPANVQESLAILCQVIRALHNL